MAKFEDAPIEAPGWREGPEAGESRESALRRLKIRCWRRGSREMDLVLGRFFDDTGAALSDLELAAFDDLLREDDADIYRWVSGAVAAPEAHAPMIARLRGHFSVS